MPGYVPLPIVNPGGEVPVVAPWVNVTGVLGQVGRAHSGSFGLGHPSGGDYDAYQDVAIPNTEWAAIDAGAKRVLYSTWVNRHLNPTGGITLYLHALSAANAVLQTWSFVFTGGDAWENWSVEATLPALTRAMRVRAAGFDWGGGIGWDDLVLAVDDPSERVMKGMAYAVEGFPLQTQGVPKAMAYGVIGPAAGSRTAVTKAMLYGVLGYGARLHVTKAMAYAVVGPADALCPSYPGPLVACADPDRPENTWGLCATRPSSAAEECGQAERPTGNAFYPGQPYPRGDCQ